MIKTKDPECSTRVYCEVNDWRWLIVGLYIRMVANSLALKSPKMSRMQESLLDAAYSHYLFMITQFSIKKIY